WDKSTWWTRTGRFGRNKKLSSGTFGPKIRGRRERPKKSRANGISPRVFTA
ncbi:hypothetical protein KI387_031833, partial [Taxus chinensis]